MKLLPLLLLLPLSSLANPYIEYKNETNKKTSDVRLGVQKKFFYVEAGPKSWETGYKVKKGNFTFKGKLESKQKKKLETEVRYTFKK